MLTGWLASNQHVGLNSFAFRRQDSNLLLTVLDRALCLLSYSSPLAFYVDLPRSLAIFVYTPAC